MKSVSPRLLNHRYRRKVRVPPPRYNQRAPVGPAPRERAASADATRGPVPRHLSTGTPSCCLDSGVTSSFPAPYKRGAGQRAATSNVSNESRKWTGSASAGTGPGAGRHGKPRPEACAQAWLAGARCPRRKCPLAALLPAGSARAKLRGSCSVHGNPPALGLNVRVSDIDP